MALGSPVRAEDAAGSEDTKKPRSGSYWGMVFQGGMLTPLGPMAEVHQSSLAAGGRFGWTSRFGLGVDVSAEYSPLSRKRAPDGDAYETHFVTTALMPRFTLGKKMLRVWVSAGPGLAYERQKRITGTVVADTSSRAALAGVSSAGLEFHPLSGAGLAVIGSYARTYGDLEHELFNITGGLVFTFR